VLHMQSTNTQQALTEDNPQYHISLMSLSFCPLTPASVTICHLIILFRGVKTDHIDSSRLWPYGLRSPPPNLFFWMARWCWWCWWLVISLPQPFSHSCINAGWRGDPPDSCPLWSELGRQQHSRWGGGLGGSLPLARGTEDGEQMLRMGRRDLSGMWYTLYRLDSRVRGRGSDENKATETGEGKTDQENTRQRLFLLLLLC